MSDFFSKSKLNGSPTDDRDRAFWMGVRQVALNLVDIIERHLEFDDHKRTSYLRKLNAPRSTSQTLPESG